MSRRTSTFAIRLQVKFPGRNAQSTSVRRARGELNRVHLVFCLSRFVIWISRNRFRVSFYVFYLLADTFFFARPDALTNHIRFAVSLLAPASRVCKMRSLASRGKWAMGKSVHSVVASMESAAFV